MRKKLLSVHGEHGDFKAVFIFMTLSPNTPKE
jgi:hypothetical protein